MRNPDPKRQNVESGTMLCHIYFTSFDHETRARRGIDAALEANLVDRVEAICYKIAGQESHETVTDRYSIRRFMVDVPFPLPRIVGRSIAWALWSCLTIIALWRRKPKLIQVHAVAALPAGVIAKWLTGSPILYDAHDLETERTGWTKFQRHAAKLLERMFIGHIDGMIVVSDMIADWYAAEYKMRRPALVRNIPVVSMSTSTIDPNEPSLRRTLGIDSEHLLFVYIGAMDEFRGIGLLLDAFALLPNNYHFCTLGYGSLVEEVEAVAARSPNIHHHPAIPARTIPAFIRDADVGTCLIEDVSMNHRYTLPNKLFETRHGGLAALVSNLPAIAGFVDQYGGGWTVELTVDAIVKKISSIDREALKSVMVTAKPIPTWEDEVKVYLAEIGRAMCRPKKH
jgi:glycosyltransferase involved in cell wall biosynthesis